MVASGAVGAHILVVEDDPALSDVVCTYLGDCGFAILLPWSHIRLPSRLLGERGAFLCAGATRPLGCLDL